jgi:hypothetical protein
LNRIHGTNEPWTIGTNVSSGCIRLTNEDIVDLYNRTPIGAKVIEFGLVLDSIWRMSDNGAERTAKT